MTRRHAAIVGCGSIGVSLALCFARAGWTVAVHDAAAPRLELGMEEVRSKLDALLRHGLLHEAVDEVSTRIRCVPDLDAVFAGASIVMECAPESLALKTVLFHTMDGAAPAEAILCSTSSVLPASSFTAELSGRGRCLVAHPANPPHLIPVIELVPSPFTDPQVVASAEAIFASLGMKPVQVRKELPGFIFNRLQGAILREAYCLVRDDVASVEDVDTIVREGLGLRWSVVGPFETADLNTRGGIESHAAKLGPGYARMGRERGQDDPWTPELVAKVSGQRRALLPLDQWEARVAWRDEQLMRILCGREADGG